MNEYNPPNKENNMNKETKASLTMEQIQVLIEELSNPATQGESIFPWEDVIDSMRQQPEAVCLSSQKCPDCGETLIELFFSSPQWTWEQLCGRAGKMFICPKCHAQKEFFLTRLN